MTETVFADVPQTVELLQSMMILMRWLSSMPQDMRERFLAALGERSDEIQGVVFQAVSIVENHRATPLERHRALATIADTLFLKRDNAGEFGPNLAASRAGIATVYAGLGRQGHAIDCQEAAFVDRLRELMDVKRVTQKELSDRVGCSQPAISQMLNRKCRPQKKTILKLAEALQVPPQELWPDLEVADLLDAVADFQQGDRLMTEAEANALRSTAGQNGPKIPVRPLPARQR